MGATAAGLKSWATWMTSFFMSASACFSAASLARTWRLVGNSPQSAMTTACRVRPELLPHASTFLTTGIPCTTCPNTTARATFRHWVIACRARVTHKPTEYAQASLSNPIKFPSLAGPHYLNGRQDPYHVSHLARGMRLCKGRTATLFSRRNKIDIGLSECFCQARNK